jgi:hypothetical protein
VVLSACSTEPLGDATATASNAAAATTSPGAASLPLGDGKVSATPRAGYVMRCGQTPDPNGGGAFHDGPWIQDGVWDPAAKIAVQGMVAWPQAAFSVQVSGAQRIITTADLPVSSTTGIFPIATSDPAYAYDRNPNRIQPQTLRYALPTQPQVATQPSCLRAGPIGVLRDGVVLFDALDAQQRDAPAHEVLDHCEGHPERTGEYHHHDIPTCLLEQAVGSATLVGYALDGFGIYVERDTQGNLLANASLDACHGRSSDVPWDGQTAPMYHYVATREYPYTVGCFMGTPTSH